MKTDNIMIPNPLYSLQELKVRMIVVGWSLLATYILFVIFFTPAHVEAWKKPRSTPTNCLATKQRYLHWREFALWKGEFGIRIWFIWYFQSTKFPQYQEMLSHSLAG